MAMPVFQINDPKIRFGVSDSERDKFIDALQMSLGALDRIGRFEPVGGEHRLTMQAVRVNAMQFSAGLVAALEAECDLDTPTSPIEMRPDADGNLALRCHHNPRHRWSLDGQRL